jgi:thiol reductant ABC exporter CydC subunit
VPYAVAAATGIGAAVLLAVLLPLAAAALVGGLALVGVVAPAVQHAAAGRAARRTAPLRGELTASAVQLLHGLPDLVAYGAVGERLAGLRHTGERLRRGAGRAAAMTGLAAAIVALASGGCVLLVLRLATPAVRAETLDGVLLAVVVLTPLAVFEAVAGLPAATEQLGTARSGLRRVFALLDEPEPVGDPDMVTALPAWPCRLRVRNASARWSPATSPEVASGLLDAPLAVEGVSLDLPPGRRIALVGPTGCGKSTVAALLVRFLDPVAGSVTLDGVDLRALTGDQVREMVTLVDAEAHLFDTTIEANLRVARADATDDQLRAALRAACLLDFVDGLPDGLDTRVGERGTALSGGQRRRLALARGLLRDPRILVLDEPTEHLDEPTAREITADLLAATRGRTVVLITHRPFGLADVDEVVTLPATMRP